MSTARLSWPSRCRWLALAALLGLLACQGDAAPASAAPQQSGGPSGAGEIPDGGLQDAAPAPSMPPPGGDAGPDDGRAACSRTPFEEPLDTQLFRSVTTRLVDASGAAADAPVTVCSFDLCIAGQTDAAGVTLVELHGMARSLRAPMLKLGDGISFAEFAYGLADQPEQDLGSRLAVRLPAGKGAPMAPGQKATHGGVTVAIQAGSDIRFDELIYSDADRGLKAVSIPVSQGAPTAAVTPSIELAWALVPQGTTFCPAATVSVPNAAGWPPGTQVEFLVHGVDLEQNFAPFGGWGVVSGGAVSADGSRIETAPGQGLPVLSTLGVRRIYTPG